jgi:S1-C subfamily serine protease
LGFAAAPGAFAATQSLPDLIDRYRPSVVLVGTYGLLDSPRFGFRGTGFAVSDGRHVLTNAHVIPEESATRQDRRVAVQVLDADRQWRLRAATLLVSDEVHDLAVLRIEGAALPPLKLSTQGLAREGADIALMGFPIGGALGFSHVTHRGIVAAQTSIALPAPDAKLLKERALRQMRQGDFQILQLDITAYPGNSGGPVFDLQSGEVVGVVSMVLLKGTKESVLSAPSGISYAIPIEHALSLLAKLD